MNKPTRPDAKPRPGAPPARVKPSPPHVAPARKVLQAKAGGVRQTPAPPPRPAPVAPPAYRPQPVPKVLQGKMPGPPTPPPASRPAPAAPAAYRPQATPKVLQRKTAAPPAAPKSRAPVAPAVYRPQAAPRCLQPKAAGSARPNGSTPAPAPRATPAAPRTPHRPPAAVQAKLVNSHGVPLQEGDVNELMDRHPEQIGEILEHSLVEEEYIPTSTRGGVTFALYRPPKKAWTYKIPEGHQPTYSDGTVYDSAKREGLSMSLDRKKMADSFTDTLLSQSPGMFKYQGAEKIESGKKLKESGLARTHHLADSAVRAIIEYLAHHREWLNSSGSFNRVRQWMNALTHGQGVGDKLLQQLIDATTSNELESIVDALSNNPWNVGIGLAASNTHIGPFFDESVTSRGIPTQMASVIAQFTEYLRGVVPGSIIDAALSQLVNKQTGEVSRSMVVSMDTGSRPGPGVYDASMLTGDQLVDLVDAALKRRIGWAVTLAERCKGDSQQIAYILYSHNMRLRVTSDGAVYVVLRGG